MQTWIYNILQMFMHVSSMLHRMSLNQNERWGETLKAVGRAAKSKGTRQQMKQIAHSFLSNREVSAQEAVYRALSLPLIRSSRIVIFVNTDLPEKRCKIFKPISKIKELDDG